MGLFDRFRKNRGAGNGDDRSGETSETVTFTVESGELRKLHQDSVEALDAALARVGTGEVVHLVDLTRLKRFVAGGPPTWSVAQVPVGDDLLLVTYGNSERIDADRAGVGFELSVRVPAKGAGLWPALLLRQLVRYMIQSGRELRVDDFMPCPRSLPQMTVMPGDETDLPATAMNAVLITEDPLLPVVDTPHGPLEIRRIVGLYPEEKDLMEPWSARGMVGLLRQRIPALTTDIERASYADEPAFIQAVAEGSRREGSQFNFVAATGVRWEATDSEFVVHIPGGYDALRIQRMVEARLHHGRNLLIHDTDPENRRAVVLVPSEDWGLSLNGELLVLQLPKDAPLLKVLENPTRDAVVLRIAHG